MFRAFDHASIESGIKYKFEFCEAEELEEPSKEDPEYEPKLRTYEKQWGSLKTAKGIFVPGGFGYRGINGKLKAIQYARENKIPFLGVCYGFQLAVIEWARNVMHLHAISQEFFKDIMQEPRHKEVIIHMPDYESDMMGGTMRLGAKSILIE